MSDQPRVAIRYNGGLWSVRLTHGDTSEHIPDFRTKEDAQFYVDARFHEWGVTSQPRHLSDADDRAALLAENKRLAERVATLETLARKLYSLAYEREFDHDSGHQTRSECRYCGQVSNMDTQVEHDVSEGGCFVADAKALLGAE